jgi:hypothetical protein
MDWRMKLQIKGLRVVVEAGSDVFGVERLVYSAM